MNILAKSTDLLLREETPMKAGNRELISVSKHVTRQIKIYDENLLNQLPSLTLLVGAPLCTG